MNQIPLEQIIREDLLDNPILIARKLFPFLNRCLNEHGFCCEVWLIDEASVSVTVREGVRTTFGGMTIE